jgi:GH35 family endo-1,4-beta-xylanase
VPATPAPSPQPQGPLPLLPRDALGAFALSGSAARAARVERVQVHGRPAGGPDGVPFGEALRARTEEQPDQDFHIQLVAKTVAPVEKDDVLLATFWIRGVESVAETAEARTAIVFEQASEPYTKSLQLGVGAGPEWQQIQIPFKAVAVYRPGQAQIIFRLGYPPQTIEIGGVSVVNYGKRVSIANLPRTRFTYAGREPDAPWRAAAAERIEAIRKGDLTVVVADAAGQPAPGAAVAVRMRRHAFGFGSAVAAQQLTGQGQDGQRYRDTILRLFTKVVMENDLKWPQWEDQSQRARTLQALQWLRDHGLAIRGHTLVWPAWRWLPRDLQALRNDPAALRKRVNDHIVEEVSALKGLLADWDVVNEPHGNHDLMDLLGNEAMVEWFHLARQADPDVRLFLNEATTPGAGPRQTHFEQTIRLLLDRGAPLGGIGFQCHYGMTVGPPERLLPPLDRFARFSLPVQVTEFDVDTTDEELQADFASDFMTAMFSHPAVDAILMWGFWEGRHWRPDAALFRRDWSLKPNGQAWIELVTQQWWTDTQGTTDSRGTFRARGFLGDYDIEVLAGGRSKTVPASLPKAGTTIRIVLE